MESWELGNKLLAAETLYMRGRIIDRLCSWYRCRDDKDLLVALDIVEELVDLEDRSTEQRNGS